METAHRLKKIIARKGPIRPHEISEVLDGFAYLIEEYGLEVGRKKFQEMVQAIPGSVHYHLMEWPKGYQGDWEIIRDIYNNTLFPDTANWDAMLMDSEEALALRGRPEYLVSHFRHKSFEGQIFVDVGCGSGMAVMDLVKHGNLDKGTLLLVDQDPEALEAARDNLGRFGRTTLECVCENILKVRGILADKKIRGILLEGNISVIWCAGVFDYMNDRLMTRVLKGWVDVIERGSEIIVGNMGHLCPNKDYLTALGWDIRYRTPDQLLAIGREVTKSRIEPKVFLGCEKTGYNYFLHIMR